MARAIATEESLGIEYDEQTVCDVCQDVSEETSARTERIVAPLLFKHCLFSFQSLNGQSAVVVTCLFFVQDSCYAIVMSLCVTLCAA